MNMNLPINSFLTIKGTLPLGESYPPSILKPKPVESFMIVIFNSSLFVSSFSCLSSTK